MATIVEIEGLTKSFPGVKALEGVHLKVARGEVMALVGENGAGKSTLMKILAGVYTPDSGTIRIEGHPVEIRSPRDAAHHGIAIIHQELELVDNLDVAGNVFLGREFTRGGVARLIDNKRTWDETEKVLQQLGAPISPRTRVSDLSLAHRQLVEIARALSLKATILLMDEPTSSLTAEETDRLLTIVQELKTQGVTIVYISHRLAEVYTVADRAVVLRDGKNAGMLSGSELTHDRMIRLMVGRELQVVPPNREPTQAAFFEIRNFRTSAYPGNEVSLTVHAGEILGIAGLVGAGRTELARAIFRVDRPLSGTIISSGHALSIDSVRDAIDAGIYLIPEDRRNLGLITAMTVKENITLPAMKRYARAGLIHRSEEAVNAKKTCDALRIKAPSVESTVSNLSGGNQQKVVLAKWLSLRPKLILFDEPTRGIDVGAKAEIYSLMRKLADEGVAIIMISSDMEEILANSDRIAVMREGQITGILAHGEFSEEAVMRLAVA